MSEESDGEGWGEGQGLVSRLLMGTLNLSPLFLSSTDLASSPPHDEDSSPIRQHELHGHQQNVLPPAAQQGGG